MPRDVFTQSPDLVDAAPPIELGRTDLTDNPATVLPNSTTDVPVNTAATKWAVTVTTTSRPVIIEATAPLLTQSTAGGDAILRLFRDGTLVQVATHNHPTASKGNPGRLRLVETPGPGQHTYEIKIRGTAGTVTVVCGVGFPAQLQVTSV